MKKSELSKPSPPANHRNPVKTVIKLSLIFLITWLLYQNYQSLSDLRFRSNKSRFSTVKAEVCADAQPLKEGKREFSFSPRDYPKLKLMLSPPKVSVGTSPQFISDVRITKVTSQDWQYGIKILVKLKSAGAVGKISLKSNRVDDTYELQLNHDGAGEGGCVVAEVSVFLPSDLAHLKELHVEILAGKISIDQVMARSVENVKILAQDATVNLLHTIINGEVNVNCTAGTIHLEEVDAKVINLASVSADINLLHVKSYSNLVSKSISGYTLLDTVIASNLLNVTSEAGYIDFTGMTVVHEVFLATTSAPISGTFTAETKVDAHSFSGNVDLTIYLDHDLPDRVQVTVDTFSGSIKLRLDDAYRGAFLLKSSSGLVQIFSDNLHHYTTQSDSLKMGRIYKGHDYITKSNLALKTFSGSTELSLFHSSS